MRDPRVRPSVSIVTIMVERIYDMMAVVLLFAINLLWFKPPASLQGDFSKVRALGIGLLVATALGIGLLIWFRKNSKIVIAGFTKLFERWHFIPNRLAKLAIGTMEQLARALRVLVNFAELAETIGWTALLWLGVAFANLLVVRAFRSSFWFDASSLRSWLVVSGFVSSNAWWCGRRLSCGDCCWIYFSGSGSRDCSRDFNRDAHYRFRSCCIVWVFLFPAGRSEFLKTSGACFARGSRTCCRGRSFSSRQRKQGIASFGNVLSE